MLSIFATGAVLTASGSAARATGSCDILKEKTQTFSDTGQRGDGKSVRAMLDTDVIFFNEGGDAAFLKDVVSNRPPPAPGVTTRMTVTDWNCRQHGTMAVTSFIDHKEQDFHGQHLAADYRSVET